LTYKGGFWERRTWETGIWKNNTNEKSDLKKETKLLKKEIENLEEIKCKV